MTKPYDLIKLAEVESISQEKIIEYYKSYINPGIARSLKILGMDKLRIVRAEGMYLYDQSGREILDFSSGFCVLNHGHNHPRILKARREFNREKRLEVCKANISSYQSVLAKNLAEIFPGDLQYSFFCNSGAEANEGALKIALLHQGPAKDKVIYTDESYHGKTFATMSVSGTVSSPYKDLFKSLGGCFEVPFGDIEAVKRLIESRTDGKHNDLGCIILEPIKGDRVLIPPDGYLKQLYELCQRYRIVMIADEVYTGFGKTGKMFGFEHGDIVPDVVTFSKTFGGGKASIAGYIVKPFIFKDTYLPMNGCTLHTTTYGGMGEECVTAIEALNIIVEDDYVGKARRRGEYLLSKMKSLQEKHSQYIKATRGIGLLCIFELHPTSELIHQKLRNKIPIVDDLLLGLFPAMIVAELLDKHDILCFTGGREDNLFLNPSFLVTNEQIDRMIEALDDIFGQNQLKLAAKLAANFLL